MSKQRTAGRVEISAVVFQEQGCWVAQCVEHDIVVHAVEAAGIERAITKAVLMNICVNAELGRDGLNGIAPAPERFRKQFEASTMDLRPRREHGKRGHRGAVKVRSMRLADYSAVG